MKVCERIQKLRMSKGLTQKELGDLLGVTKETIKKYENGQIRNLKADTIKKLTDYFGVPPVNFIYDSNEIPNYSKPAIESFLYTYFGEDTAMILKNINLLNEDGIRKVIEYVNDIVEIQKYKKDVSI